MTTLQAIQLLKSKRPEQVSPDELAELQALLERSPSIYTALGGRDLVERFLAAADEALAATAIAPRSAESTATAVQAVPTVATIAGLSRRRAIEIAVFAALLLGAAIWLYALIARHRASQDAGSEVAATDSTSAAGAGTQQAARPLGAKSKELEYEPANRWRGWKIEAATGATVEKKHDWNLTAPGGPAPVRHLITRGGQVTIQQKLTVPTDARSIRIDCHQVEAGKLGELQLVVDGQVASRAKVPPIGTTLPVLLSLPTSHGPELNASLVYTAGDASEQLLWRNVDFTAEAADVVALSGEPDATKPSLRLWLRSDAGIKDSAGRAVGATGFDNLVQSWDDQSTRHLPFVCDGGDASRRPTYAPQPTLGGKSAVTFDGVKQFLRVNGEPVYHGADSSTWAVFDVGQRTVSLVDTAPPRCSLNIECQIGPKSRRQQRKVVKGIILTFDAPTRLAFNVTPYNGRFVIALIQVHGGQSFVEVNGTGRTPANLTGSASGPTMVLGLPLAAAAAPVPNPLPVPPPLGGFGGSLAELLVYDRVLTPFEIRQIGQYLRSKYNITAGY